MTVSPATCATPDTPGQPDSTPAESGGAAGQGGATYTIAELAREFDITPRAIRFYEDQGLLSPARVGSGGRQRVYNGRQRTRLRLTLRGKRLGLTLNEIREILDLYESPRDTAPQLERFLASLAQHRRVLERQMEDLQAQLAEIEQHERQCRALLEEHARTDASGTESQSAVRRVR
ncbi:MerR family DNA-binding transcriptional regulator [Cupriavidus sp. AU9028]|uniref:MerR family transcriptional regulator n=1 Tax=Cupriavidus sp. AU9028 TaxID=2871157 RepID=UPI001C94AD29|nr:MerR family DNA-binding transcriptional regulator [Cupriavidus sp. AU9028]MBY4896731.1 MerR family DNA-binding transcriptional regulator [Cupriavidus sp. AU9028]